jgi:hypothetical protein
MPNYLTNYVLERLDRDQGPMIVFVDAIYPMPMYGREFLSKVI